MTGLGTALLSVGADVSQFEDDLAGALDRALGKNKFAAVLATSAAAGVAAVIKEFIPLEKALLQIFQVQGVEATDEMFAALSAQVLDLASEVGKPAEEVGAAIALGIGRGFSQQEAIDLSEISSNLSVALGEDLAASAKGVTAALNGFNLEVEEADRVAGVLFQTVAKSGVPMSQLAQQIGNIAPAARNAGVELEDVSAAVATMVQQGVSAAESTTQIRTAITELSRAGSDGGKVFQSIAGKTFPEFIKEGHTLGEALGLIQAAADKSGYSVQELTGNYNTANAVTAVAVNGLQNYTKNLYDNERGTKAMAGALDSANQGVFRQFQVALNNIRTGVQRLGTAFRPLIQAVTAEVVPVITAFGDKLNELGVWLSTVDFTPIADGIAWLVDKFSVIGPLFQAIFNLFAGLNWQQIGDAAQAVIVPVAAAISLLSGAIQLLTQVIQFVTPAVQVLLDVISFLAVPLAVVAGLFAGLGTLFAGVVAGLYALNKVILLVRASIFLLRGAAMLLWTAFGPVGAIVVAIGLLTAAFIYAWKESETFRKVVVTGFNAVKDAVVTGVEWMIKTYMMFPRAVLSGFESILRGLGHIPKWLGGGAFDSAADAVRGLINGLDAISTGVTNVANAARRADWELNNMISSAERAAEAAAHAGLWFGNADTDAALRDALKGNGGGGGAPANLPAPNVGGLDDILNPDKKKSKDAAAAALARVKDMLRDIFEAVQELAEDIGEKSVDAIESSFDSIIKKYNEAIAAAAAAGRTSIVKDLRNSLKDIQKFEKTLLKLAQKRDVIADRLKEAEDALASLRQESDQFEAATKAAFYNIGSVAEASAGIGVTFRGIRNNMRDAIRTTDLFNQAIKDLQKLGLNEDSLRQLAEAGPAALDQARALVRSGAAGIKEINELEALLDDASGKVADRLADDFYNAGIAAADGLVEGLKKQLPKIIAEMEKVADAMTNSVKKKLKIKSPSGVFDQEIGRMIPAGAAAGVRRGIPELVKAVDAMAAASTGAAASFGTGAVQINGVSDPMAAQRAGILAGEAIAYTLEKRRTAQRLAGVG